MFAERRNSPLSGRPSTSRRTVWDRSPFAMAVMVRVTSEVGQSKSSIKVLMDFSISPQEPERRSMVTRWRVLPSLPTIWPARSISRAMRWFDATISLNVSAIFPAMPVRSLGSRTEKSPSRTACSERSNFFRSRSGSAARGLTALARRRTRSWVSIRRLRSFVSCGHRCMPALVETASRQPSHDHCVMRHGSQGTCAKQVLSGVFGLRLNDVAICRMPRNFTYRCAFTRVRESVTPGQKTRMKE